MAISPIPQNIEAVFSTTTYHIDFYQRQYKWLKDPVERLLDDVFYKFNTDYIEIEDSMEAENAANKIGWYYLNTYVTNTIDGKVFLVDGQQRLTTITLILIQLYRQSINESSDLSDWVKSKIFGIVGPKKIFWLHHEGHITTMEKLLNGEEFDSIDISLGVTSRNMVENSKYIRNWLDSELTAKHKLETFIYYFLRRLDLVKLEVSQAEVPMVFEVINDRGVRLKPYEILKGKLLGQIDKDELKNLNLNSKWEEQVNKINTIGEDEIDSFFEYYLRSKISNTRGLAIKYDKKDYHRAIFNDECNERFSLKRNPSQIKQFIQNEFVYFTNLYHKIWKLSTQLNQGLEAVFFNDLNDLNAQYLLILSAIKFNDPEEDFKIASIAKEFDKMFVLLQLQRSYDSNKITEVVYQIMSEIREETADKIKPAFENQILKMLSNAKATSINDTFNYVYFREVGYNDLSTRFNRYFFSRIDYFICQNTGAEMQHSFHNLVRNTGTVNGFHIEHILAHNDENIALFNNDEELFERERNRLGGLLLLRGNANISSSNETYENKLRTYAQTLYWNATLHPDTYHSNLDLINLKTRYNLNLRAMESFGAEELEERHRLLAEIIKIIWN